MKQIKIEKLDSVVYYKIKLNPVQCNSFSVPVREFPSNHKWKNTELLYLNVNK